MLLVEIGFQETFIRWQQHRAGSWCEMFLCGSLRETFSVGVFSLRAHMCSYCFPKPIWKSQGSIYKVPGNALRLGGTR